MLRSKEKSYNQKEALRKSEERYLKMIEEIQDYVILLLDLEGRVENWNLGAQKIKGYNADEIIGKSHKLFYRPEDQQAGVPDKLLKEAADNGRAEHEGWRVRKDGSFFWANTIITALHNEEGEVTGFMKITRDLTEQKAIEEQVHHYIEELTLRNADLRSSEERYHRMVEEVQDYAILLLDTQGNIQNWNKGAERIKGYRPEEIIGKNFVLFYTKEDRQTGLPGQLLEKARRTGKALQEGWRVRKDGTRFWASVVITALHDSSGAVTGFSKVTRDQTEKKLADDTLRSYATRLEHNNIELERFAYVASHDLKEPLRKVLTFGNLLETNSAEAIDERGRDYIQRMQNAATRMMTLIDDLLAFSRVSRPTEGFEAVDLNTVVSRVVTDLEVLITSRKGQINIGQLPQVQGRKSQLEQVFQNLISNALKFNENPIPQVDITADIEKNQAPEPSFARIFVTDNGIGFESQYRDRIFEIFQRLHGKHEYGGTGIGLAICKKIIDAHGGSISAVSAPGEGATFTIRLPL